MPARTPVEVRRALENELVRRGLAVDADDARQLVRARRVTVDDAPALNPARQVASGQHIAVASLPSRYVSRGGRKLAGALDRLRVDVDGRRCLDAGAATGGFTDCLLQRGAAHVIAVDVGYGLLDERLRRDPRVTVRERTNIRHLGAGDLPDPPCELVVADLSFISLAQVLPALRSLVADHADGLLLVKPQFEAPRELVEPGGVVRDPQVWRQTVTQVAAAGRRVGWQPRGVVPTTPVGPAGNVEFMLRLESPAPGDGDLTRARAGPAARGPDLWDEQLAGALEEARRLAGEVREPGEPAACRRRPAPSGEGGGP